MTRRKNDYRFSFLLRIAVVAALCIFLLSASCSLKEPVAPQWDVTIAIPLINRAITVQELMDETEYLIAGDNGLANIDYEEEFERFEVGDQLKIADLQESFLSQLGEFRVPSPGVNSTDMTFGQIFPPVIILDGQTVPIAGFSYEDIGVNLPSFNSFESILIESGTIQLTINNRLPVPLAAGAEIEVRNKNTNEVLFSIFFNSDINPGASSMAEADLAGVRIPSEMSVYLSGGSPGSGGQPVQINANTDGLDVDALISEIVAVEAEAIIEAQQFSGSDSLSLGDSILVNYAGLASGLFRLDIDNDIPLDVELDLLLDDFTDAIGNPVTLNIPLLSGQSTTRIINLFGYSFQPGSSQDELTTHFSWTASVSGSNGAIVTLKKEDSVGLDIRLTSLAFSEVRGFLDNVRVQLDPLEDSIDLPDDIDSVQFEFGSLELTINNGIGFTIFPDIKIMGLNESTGKSSEIAISQQIAAGNGEPVPTSIILDKSNSNIVEFINILPNKILVSGEVFIGDGSNEGIIRSTDFIESIVHISAPLSLSYPSQSVKSEVDTFKVDLEVQEQLRDNVLAGKLVAQISNRIPVGMQVSLHVSGLDTSVFSNPELTIGPLDVNASQGRVEELNEIIVDLSKEEISVFENDNVFVGVSAYLPGSNGEAVRFYADDYIKVQAYAEFTYHVDPDSN